MQRETPKKKNNNNNKLKNQRSTKNERLEIWNNTYVNIMKKIYNTKIKKKKKKKKPLQ